MNDPLQVTCVIAFLVNKSSLNMSQSCREEYYCGLRVHRLADVLAHVPLPPNCPLSGVSSKWRCVISPRLDDPSEALPLLCRGVPCRLAASASADIHTRVDDAFDFLDNPEWSTFPAPKIAFRAGWAGPGTEMEAEEYHKLITSFRDVTDHSRPAPDASIKPSPPLSAADANGSASKDEEILNLQLFHRADAATHPQLPILAEQLQWPAYLSDGAVCDNATRVSQRGAITWWHLDDSGEFVMQTGLRLHPKPQVHCRPHDGSQSCCSNPAVCRELYDNRTSDMLPVKLFIYGPPDSYDWFMHDDESDTSGKIAALQIFATPDDLLPKDDSLLPILTIAMLESGGRPLVSPPNIPHAVFTVNDCVMVEQRRVCNLFLDEVAYFLQKVKHWAGNPIVYQYVEKELQDEQFIHDVLVPGLLKSALEKIERAAASSDDRVLLERLVASLYAIHSFDKCFALDVDGRASLSNMLQEGSPLGQVLRGSPVFRGLAPPASRREKCTVIATPRFVSLQAQLEHHWNVTQHWTKPGCVFKAFPSAPPAGNDPEPQLIPVVYWRSSPVFGVEKLQIQDVVAEYRHMASLISCSATDGGGASPAAEVVNAKSLLLYLATVKKQVEAKDDLLDELF